MESPPSQYRKEWHQTYFKHLFPFEHILRFITCNKPDVISPQCRGMRFDSYKNSNTLETWKKTQFNRVDEVALRQQLIWIFPITMHIYSLLNLSLEPGKKIDNANLTTKRKRDDSVIESPQQHRHRDFVHCISTCKELVFDIDVHDFDRFCDCVKTQRKILCRHCWLHIEGSYFIMQFILTQLFGYNSANILYVFSGGKGIHCFVNDSRAMSLSEEQRYCMYDIIYVGSGKNHKDDESEDIALCQWIRKYATPELSATLEKFFMSHVIENRNIFVECPSFRPWFEDKLRHYYPSTYANLIKTMAWQDLKTESSIIWNLLKTLEIYDFHIKSTMIIEASLFFTYRLFFPKIDKGPLAMTHSIKLPYSIHTTTRNIALPVDQSFFECHDKQDVLVTLETLVAAHYEKRPLPLLFTQGIDHMDRYLKMYDI